MAEKQNKGFRMMSPEERSRIARLGGKAAHAAGTAHRFTPEEAKLAGAKGGSTTGANSRHMAEIGRAGGLKSVSVRAARKMARQQLASTEASA